MMFGPKSPGQASLLSSQIDISRLKNMTNTNIDLLFSVLFYIVLCFKNSPLTTSHVNSRMDFKNHFLAISYLLLLFWFLRLDHETKIACSTSGRKVRQDKSILVRTYFLTLDNFPLKEAEMINSNCAKLGWDVFNWSILCIYPKIRTVRKELFGNYLIIWTIGISEIEIMPRAYQQIVSEQPHP